VLAPSGVFACSDWMKGDDSPKSAELLAYEALEGLGFGLASPDVYFAALRAAGLERVTYVDRTPWLAATTPPEPARGTGTSRSRSRAQACSLWASAIRARISTKLVWLQP